MQQDAVGENERKEATSSEERWSEPDGSDFGDSLLERVLRPPLSSEWVLALRPGARLGGKDGRRFELLAVLGQGGMGKVFRARDAELQREVALKLLFPSEGQAELALREARAIAQLDHENIVRIFDVGEWSAAPELPRIPFLVMEYLEGESLEALLRRERPALARTLELLRGVAAGLAHAHAHRVIHRDLKPSNIFLTRQGGVKLLDFGLASLGVPSGEVPHLPTAGTPAYMAPEQWRGEAVDARTDLWATGVVLYEMLTGELPYPSSTSPEDLKRQVLAPEPVALVRERDPKVTWELEALVSALLAKAPAQRLLTAEDLREELRELEAHLVPGRRASDAMMPQRRQVTLVSCRVEGLAALSEELDPEDFGELEASFHRRASEVLQRHGGFITLCLGDEVLACFGYPVAREEDSERSASAGLALPAAVHAALREKLPPGPAPALAVQVGIHTDMVVLDDILPELRGRTPAIQGEAPRVAAWLARQAGPDEVVVSHTADTLVRRAFETRELGPRPFEGRRSVAVYHLGARRQVVSRFERGLVSEGLSPLVGREREAGELLASWTRAREGQGHFVLLRGEAGIGKSRLIQELRERVSPFQAPFLRMQCWPQYSTSALYPVIELLRRAWLHPELPPRENLRRVEAMLAGWRVAPQQTQLLAALLGLPVAEDAPHRRLPPERQKEETQEALATVLMRSAEDLPMVLVLEDLHWADPSTLQLLRWLLERVGTARVLGVLSARPEFRFPWPAPPQLRELTLERLPADHAARLVREVARGRELPEELLAQLVARTDGIPLFVEEMTRSVLEQGPSPSIPVTLQELLLARLDALPRRQKELAQLCALVGRGFSPALLALLTGREEASLRRTLLGLVAAGLLQPRQDTSDYQFRHALIQEAACQSLPRSARRQHHRRIAQTLEAHFPQVVETEPEVLAHHYTEAGDFKPAIRYWRQAGLRASLRSANQEAVSHLTQALGLLRRLPDATTLSSEELQLLLVLGIPLSQVKGYSSPEVEQTYSRVQVLVRAVGDALPHLEFSLWGAFAYYFARGLYQEAYEVATLLVDLGQRQGDRTLLAIGHRMLATSFFNWGRMVAALEHVERALQYADTTLEEHRRLALLHWVDLKVAPLTYGAEILSVMGHTERAERFTREALALADRIGHPHTKAFALTYCAIAAQLRGEVRWTLELSEQGIAHSDEHRFLLWLLSCHMTRGWALSELGRPQEGLAVMREARERWDRLGLQAGTHYHLGMMASIHLKLNQPQEGLALVEQALMLRDKTGVRSYAPELHRLRGELLWRLGREEQARESFQVALALAQPERMEGYARRARASLAALEGEREHAGR